MTKGFDRFPTSSSGLLSVYSAMAAVILTLVLVSVRAFFTHCSNTSGNTPSVALVCFSLLLPSRAFWANVPAKQDGGDTLSSLHYYSW